MRIRDGRRLHRTRRSLPASVRHFIDPLVQSGIEFFGAAPDVAANIASVAAPAITGAGVGALGAAATGGKPLTGALIGGGIGAIGGALSDYFGPGSAGASTGTGSQFDVSTAPSYATPADLLDSSGNPIVPPIPPDQAGGSLTSTSSALAKSGLGGLFGGGKGISGTALALGILSMLGSAKNKPQMGTWQTPGPSSTAANTGPNFTQPLNTNVPGRASTQPVMSQADWYTYGQRPEMAFFSGNSLGNFGFAHGGALAAAQGGQEFSTESGQHHVVGPGTGTSDSIPARLSNGEFVLSRADVDRVGNGNNERGARMLEHDRGALAKALGEKKFVREKLKQRAA